MDPATDLDQLDADSLARADVERQFADPTLLQLAKFELEALKV